VNPPRARPLYLPTPVDTVFGMFHEPASERRGTAVIICPPWGWDEIASYRSRRAWAEHLAATGHPTLRFDLPATGDSAGAPSEPGRVPAWTAAVSAAASWLRTTAGHPRVAALGLGLGGLLAGAAASQGAPIEELILWATPTRGRSFGREMQAFARLRKAGDGRDREPSASPLPEGWLESGGFVLSAETLAALEELDLGQAQLSGLERALLLDRDGIATDPSISERLAAGAVEVSEERGDGWADMVVHPEHSKPPAAVFERVSVWLGGAVASAPGSPAGEAREQLELEQGGTRVRERPIEVEQGFGAAFGILAEPVERSSGDLCVVLLNAGAVRRVGSNRMWVETSRRLAASGVRSLRLDFEGLGDADGDAAPYDEVGAFYAPAIGDQVIAALDALERRGLGSRFALVGLCAGGYWAFQIAARDPRVRLAVVVNAGALVWRNELPTEREARKLGRVLRWRWWRRLVRGEISVARLRVFGAALRRRLWQLTRGRVRPAASVAAEDLSIAEACERLSSLETRVAMAFATGEPLLREIESDGTVELLRRVPGFELTEIPDADHTVRPIAAQRQVGALIDDAVGALAAS
jgi:pimeloyl-ACP methyl ester carboxylesterase